MNNVNIHDSPSSLFSGSVLMLNKDTLSFYCADRINSDKWCVSHCPLTASSVALGNKTSRIYITAILIYVLDLMCAMAPLRDRVRAMQNRPLYGIQRYLKIPVRSRWELRCNSVKVTLGDLSCLWNGPACWTGLVEVDTWLVVTLLRSLYR